MPPSVCSSCDNSARSQTLSERLFVVSNSLPKLAWGGRCSTPRNEAAGPAPLIILYNAPSLKSASRRGGGNSIGAILGSLICFHTPNALVQ